MFSLQNREFVFRDSQNKLWNFFYDDTLGVCYSIYLKSSKWASPYSINKNASKLFCAQMDADNYFHLLLQDNSGSLIYYSINQNGDVEKTPILVSKNQKVYDKHLYIISTKGKIQFFYMLEHNNGHILSHQQMFNGKLTNPKVLDYVVDNSSPYCVNEDKFFNLYVFYQISDENVKNKVRDFNAKLGYKKYLNIQKTWSEFIPLFNLENDHESISEFPKAIVDANNILHLCSQRRTGKQFELVYQQKVPDKNNWSSETLIYSSSTSFEQSSILLINNKLFIYWIREANIFFSSSSDYGNSWSRAARHNFQYSKQLVCISYKSNMENDYGKLATPYIPASFVNGISMAFYNNKYENNRDVSVDQLKTMIIDSFKTLEQSVEDLENEQKSIKDQLIQISNILSNLEKETTKTSLKYNTLESQSVLIKQLSSKIESIKAETTELTLALSAQLSELVERVSNLIQ